MDVRQEHAAQRPQFCYGRPIEQSRTLQLLADDEQVLRMHIMHT